MIKPHRTVPHVPWTASHHWDLGVKRLFTLIFGLSIFGIGEALIVQGNLGNSPWVVFADGLSRHTPLNIGWATFVTSAVVLALWIPLKEKPGFGTLANIAVIAYFLQVGVDFIPKTHNIYTGLVMTFGGIAIVGLGSAFYITSGLGRGPRDGLMTSIHRLTGVRVGRVRMMVEVAALTVGFLLGGHVGIGTALFALLIGNSLALWFAVFHHFFNSSKQ